MFSHSIDRRLVSLIAPGSMEAEQYQALRLKIERFHRANDVRVIAVTSPGAKDGKTVTSINLAGALSGGSDARVLLIEADVRRPAVARYLGYDDSTGPTLSQLVLDPGMKLADAVRRVDSADFDVIFAGPRDSGPAHEMFRSARLETVLAEARAQYDYVIIDTPPLGPVSDCALLARWVDGLLIVVAAHKTPRKMLEEALNQLDGATVLGIVFNGDDRPVFGYRSAYYRGYFHQDARKVKSSGSATTLRQ